MKLRPADSAHRQFLTDARHHLCMARGSAIAANCPRLTKKIRSAIASLGGAERHIRRRLDAHVPTWSAEDQRAAMREGWAIFNEDTTPEIQRDDQSTAFSSDINACAHVLQEAAKGSALHARALAFAPIEANHPARR